MNETQESKTYTAPEAAEILGVSPQTIRNRIRDARLPGYTETDPATGHLRYYAHAVDVDSKAEKEQSNSEDIVRRYTETMAERLEDIQHANHEAFSALLRNQEQGLKILRQITKLLSAALRDEGLVCSKPAQKENQ